jgi:hypothetical protein
MIIRSSFGLRTRAGADLAGRPANVQLLIKEEQVKEVNKVAPKFIREYEKRVANWSDESTPKFVKVVIPRGPNEPLSMFIQTRGSDHARKTFEMIDRAGRGRKMIRNRFMKFRYNYFSKTAAVDVYGRGSRRTGPVTTAWVINQGAVEPRRFSDAIEEQLKPEFRNAIRRATLRALRRKGAR